MDEFIPHYLVKILIAYTQAGHGSGELFDSLINSIIKAMASEEDTSMKYTDMIRFFEVFPNPEVFLNLHAAKLNHWNTNKNYY